MQKMGFFLNSFDRIVFGVGVGGQALDEMLWVMRANCAHCVETTTTIEQQYGRDIWDINDHDLKLNQFWFSRFWFEFS